jgi:hypothetical protein
MFKGPGTIFRKSTFKEASVCVFGWDSETESTAFSRKQVEEIEVEDDSVFVDADQWSKLSHEGSNDEGDGSAPTSNDNKIRTPEGGENEMKLEELKEKHPDLFAQVVQIGMDQATEKFSAEKDALQGQITDMQNKLSAGEERMAKLEKENALSREAALKAEADSIFSAKFAESDVPDRLKGKVRNQVNHEKFMKDDALDAEAFAQAVETELKDWAGITTSSVDGSGFSNREPEDSAGESQFAQENDDLADNLLKLAGQTAS